MTDDNLFGLKAKPRKAAKPPAPPSDVQRLVGLWADLFACKFKEKPVVTPADAMAMKRLVRDYGASKVEGRLAAYFRIVDGLTDVEGYPLRLLPRAWNRLVAAERTERGAVPDAAATQAYQRRMKGQA